MLFLSAFAFAFLWDLTLGWGYKDGILHNSIWLEQAAGVYHRESRNGKYQLTYKAAQAVCQFEGGKLATKAQLEEAHKIGFHVCAAGWLAGGRVGYPIVKPGPNCGFGRTGVIDYGYRVNKSEKWDAYCYNPNGNHCGGVLTNQNRTITSPDYPNNYEDDLVCYWHIRLQYGQRIHLQFLYVDIEDDFDCLADYLEVYDGYGDFYSPVGRFCGDELPEDILSTGNVMTLKFLTDASVTAGGFEIQYVAVGEPSNGKNGNGHPVNYRSNHP
ncbi:tumor necrosis factor-inducible gene 6 protein [Protopterus annectens]|uniref:tumor necrosis factor-inducible gene 6 protein n=1 Tax=Protopterus annectens TaxID=7888 RepID=UPI001CF9756E|nr:tumor necrosis factor-inducible gene 6 protein [Protopterus annectens]